MKIFISYRRAEDNKSYIVGTIHERIAKVFGKEDVFRDTYDIAGGSDWRQILEREITSCKVMLVIIGPDWASLAYPNGEKRLFDPEDVTRWEVETGLRRSREENITFIPVLVTGAQIPKVEELPESLYQLLDKNVINLRNFPDFDSDMEKLIRDIRSSQGFREDDIKIADYEPKTIYIAEGSFWMGSDPGEGIKDYDTPRHKVSLPTYRISKYPVLNREYAAFITQSGTQVSAPLVGFSGLNPKDGLEDQPVKGVTLEDASAYCKWLSEMTERKYDLPNEAQLEKTYQGPYGCLDIVEDIYLWTCTLWGEDLSPPKYRYPWKNDGRNNPNANSQIRRVVCRYKRVAGTDTSHRESRSGQFPKKPLSPERYSFRVVMNI